MYNMLRSGNLGTDTIIAELQTHSRTRTDSRFVTLPQVQQLIDLLKLGHNEDCVIRFVVLVIAMQFPTTGCDKVRLISYTRRGVAHTGCKLSCVRLGWQSHRRVASSTLSTIYKGAE